MPRAQHARHAFGHFADDPVIAMGIVRPGRDNDGPRVWCDRADDVIDGRVERWTVTWRSGVTKSDEMHTRRIDPQQPGRRDGFAPTQRGQRVGREGA